MFSNRLFETCSSLFRSSATCPSVLRTPTVTLAWPTQSRLNSTATWRVPSFEFAKLPVSPKTEDKIWEERSKEALAEAARRPPADAYAGRSRKVVGDRVADTLREVEGILNRNKVRYYFRLRRRHEKNCEKLQRLRSERWRKQFAAAVRQKAFLVTKIRNRGA